MNIEVNNMGCESEESESIQFVLLATYCTYMINGVTERKWQDKRLIIKHRHHIVMGQKRKRENWGKEDEELRRSIGKWRQSS